MRYRPELFYEAGRHFDEVAAKIKDKNFTIIDPPESGICKECDLQSYCLAEGTIG